MGFFGSLVGAVVKTVITPVAIVKDVVNVAVGDEPDATEKHIKSIEDSIDEAFDDIS